MNKIENFQNHITEDQAIIKLEELAKEIAKHRIAYFEHDQPLITDSEYDALVQKNQDIESLFPHLMRKDSPSLIIGSTIKSEFSKIIHTKPMLSLANAFSTKDVADFISRIKKTIKEQFNIVAEPKIDGVSFAACYKNGHLSYGSTRGDGYIGEDITANIKVVKNFPLFLTNAPDTIEVRGEIFIDHDDFSKINQERQKNNLPLFANPRNAASGSLRQLDANITASRNLRYFAYNVTEPHLLGVLSQFELLRALKDLGFCTDHNAKLFDNLAELMKHYDETYQLRSNLNYDIDGIVYKINQFNLQEKLGYIRKSPKWAIAHKFPAQQGKTIIKNITIQKGRTGVLTPVAELSPINIGGVIVSRATLHNYDEIMRKDIRINDTVTIQRAGDVIPQIVMVDLSLRHINSTSYIFPNICPSCGSNTVKEEGFTAIYCINGLKCPAQNIERIKHFVSRAALNIEGLGSAQVEYLINIGLINNPVDIFLLADNIHKTLTPLRKMPGWGEKSVNNLLQSIERSKDVELAKFIYSLGIRHVGEETAKLLANHYMSLDNWQNKMIQAITNEQEKNNLLAINGIGQKLYIAIKEFFSLNHNIEIMNNLSAILKVKSVILANISSDITNKIVVFTGSLANFTREELKKQAEIFGAQVTSTITRKTDYLIVGSNPGSKYDKALELGINILTEQQWSELIKNVQ